jgi:hypothetical protein
MQEGNKGMLTASNEFEALFGGTYDWYEMKERGVLGDVPWQILAYEPLSLIPQQLLPFTKPDPQEYYVDRSANPGFFMYNPIVQSIAGLGFLELVLRGGVLALLYALFHRWYARNSRSFWATLLYVFLMVWSYYTIRASTFGFLVLLLYSFGPTVLVLQLIGRRAVPAE